MPKKPPKPAPQGSSRETTPTPAPKRRSERREALSPKKRQKGDAPPDDDSAVSDAHEPRTDSTDGPENGGLTMEEVMKILDDDEDDFDFDDHSSDENESAETIRQLVVKVEGLPKNIANLAELRTLLAQLPPGDLLGQLKSWTAIVAATPSIGNIDVLKNWVKSDLFKDDFMYLLKGYILPDEVQTDVRTRGDDFDTVMSIILEMKSHQNRALTKEKVDRSKWKYCDWLASTLQRVFERNEGDCGSIFAGAKVDDERKYVIYFATIRQSLSEGSKSRRDRLWSTLGITTDEKKELIDLFPHLKKSFASGMKAARAEERKLLNAAKEASKNLTPMQKKELVKKAKATRKAAAVSSLAREIRNFRKPEDGDEEDELMDSLLLKGSDAWKEEFKQGGLAWKELNRTSETFDIDEPYWSDLFVKKALDSLESYAEQATEEVPYVPDRNLTLAPTMGPKVAKLHQVFDPNNLVLPSTPHHTRRKDREETEANQTPVKRLHELTEGAGMYNTLASFLEERNFWNAELNSTDQEADAKAVNTTAALIVPDETAQVALAEVDKALDNIKLQREDLAKAKATFGIPDDADKLNVPGMRPSKAATHWQLLAADAMVDAFKDERITGILLSDDVGLGKTWSCISFMLKIYKKLRGPILVVVPPHLIDQWADELFKATDVFKIHVYYGDGREKTSKNDIQNIEKLTRDHEVFNGENPGRNVIITSYPTAVQRNGLKTQRGWMITKGLPVDSNENILPEPDIRWERCLKDKLGVLVLDEVHQIRNTDTQTFKTMQSLRAQFNVLLSATPSFNHIEDLKGMLSFLLAAKNEELWDTLNPPQDYNPFSANADPQYKPLLFTLRGLNRWVWNTKDDPLRTAVSLMTVWQECVIRRTVNSRIPFIDGNLIGENIPPAIRKVVTCSFTPIEQAQYNSFSAPPLANLVERTAKGGCVWRMDQFRMLTLLNTWIGSQYTHQHLTARSSTNLAKLLNEQGKLGKMLAHKALQQSQKVIKLLIAKAEREKKDTKTLVDAIHDLPKDAKDLDSFVALCALLHGAPKIREWLNRVRLEVHHLQEKSIVWCSNPGQQFLAAAVLDLAGICCEVYHADLTSAQRSQLIKRFTEDPKSPMVMVCSYYVNSAGCNLQPLCRNVHLLCTPMGLPIAAQAIGRVRRLGQTKIVKVYEYHLEKSFDEDLISRNISKAIPALALSLNDANWKFQLDSKAKGGVTMPPYLLNRDQTISDVDDVWLPYLRETDFVAPEAFLTIMLRAQSNTTAFKRPNDQMPDAIEKLLSYYHPAKFPEGCKTTLDIYYLPVADLKTWLEKTVTEDESNILQEKGETLDNM
ncbi:hypothetical protein ZTR_00025 [Talaromyces verruculosus]|nr:hypothetical protein ZTR_00025 [Talaromyces verruculosus]